MTKSCPKGQYYCYTDNKCKKIPKGYAVGARGYLKQEPQEDDSKNNGNGNGNGNSKSNGSSGNGGGNGNGGNGGNGGSGGVSEATMTSSQKRKDTMLKKKYDDSDMKKSMKKQYGKEEGEKVYYATIRKQAMENTDLGTLEGVKYYDGSDRNPNTGLPKGLKGGNGKSTDKPLKGVPYNILRAHYEIPVQEVKVTGMDEVINYKTFAQQAQDARDKKAKRREEGKKKDDEFMAKKKERVAKGVKFYDSKGKGYVKSGVKTYEENDLNMNEEGLRDWFGKSKSKDGKSGWVNVKTGGTCASDEPGEGTPKCVSSSKRASMSKAERESASRRKKAADPGQQSKTNAAKPTYVSTDKKKMKKESIEIQEMGGKGNKPVKVNLKDLVNKAKNNPKNKNLGVKTIDTDTTVHTEESELDRLKAILKSGMMNGKKLTPQQRQGMEAGISQGQGMSQQKEGKSYADFMEACWKGYEKKGMKTMFGKRYPNCVKKTKSEEVEIEEDSRLTSSNSMQSKMYADKNKSGKKMSDDEIKKEKGGKDFLARLKAAKEKMKKESIEEKVNLKDKSSQYARSTKEVDTAMTEHVNRTKGKHFGKDGRVTDVGRYRKQSKREARNELISMNKEAVSEAKDKKGKGSGTKDACYSKVKSRYDVWPSAYASGALVKCRKVGAANWGNSSKKEGYEYADEGLVDGVRNVLTNLKTKIKQNSDARKKYRETNPGGNITKSQHMQQIRNAGGDPSHMEGKTFTQFQQECWKTHKKVGMKMKGGKLVNDCRPKNEEAKIDEGAAWTKKAGKNKEGGLNEKGRKSYERENPGSDLKAPSKKVGNKRRASFCARMKGMRKRQKPSNNTGDDRLSKSLRKWNC